jgi:putative hydrolase
LGFLWFLIVFIWFSLLFFCCFRVFYIDKEPFWRHNIDILSKRGQTMQIQLDPHTHSLASGHAGQNTITDLAKQAAKVDLKAIGITDHAPATPGSSKASYFRSLSYAPKKRCGIEILYGVELNILDFDGNVDLDDEILSALDYAIVSMHLPNIKPGNKEETTFAYVNAMKHPKAKIVGHPEDASYTLDYEALVLAAKHYHVAIEVNNASLMPEGYRGNVHENVRTILDLCKKHSCPIVISSDAHSLKQVGYFQYALEMVKASGISEELIMNRSVEAFKSFIHI